MNRSYISIVIYFLHRCLLYVIKHNIFSNFTIVIFKLKTVCFKVTQISHTNPNKKII